MICIIHPSISVEIFFSQRLARRNENLPGLLVVFPLKTKGGSYRINYCLPPLLGGSWWSRSLRQYLWILDKSINWATIRILPCILHKNAYSLQFLWSDLHWSSYCWWKYKENHVFFFYKWRSICKMGVVKYMRKYEA